MAWIATQLLGSLPPTSELYPSVKTLSTINKYLELDKLELNIPFNKDNIMVKALLAASFPHPLLLGQTEA